MFLQVCDGNSTINSFIFGEGLLQGVDNLFYFDDYDLMTMTCKGYYGFGRIRRERRSWMTNHSW